MAYEITEVQALEVLDSRGRPTLEVTVSLASGDQGTAGVPSGASTGRDEAVELRDGDPSRYGGAGVQGGVMRIEGEVSEATCGRGWGSLGEVDQALISLDGTPTKSRLGANTIVGVSMATARAFATADGVPLHDWLAPEGVAARLPVPHFNVLNGGAHAQTGLAFQEFMVAPLGAPTFREALRAGAEVYTALRQRLHGAGLGTGLGDEGGFAPDLARPEDALDLLVGAIADAGYQAARDGIAIALDPAASGFRLTDGRYDLGDEQLSSAELIERYAAIVSQYPVWSIEDGLGEDDWDGWRQLTDRLGDAVQLVGDDIFVTNPGIIASAIETGVANAALIKLNQIGTVTETLDAMRVCRHAGYAQMVSHRSGETTDAFIADLAVATGCGQIKAGAPARGERVAKYNRLAAIETTHPALPFGLPGGPPTGQT
jgi:enolase